MLNMPASIKKKKKTKPSAISDQKNSESDHSKHKSSSSSSTSSSSSSTSSRKSSSSHHKSHDKRSSSHKNKDHEISSSHSSSSKSSDAPHKRKHKEDNQRELTKKPKLNIPPPPQDAISLHPADLLASLPDISPNYKPLPKIDFTNPSRHATIEEMANMVGQKKHLRTMVYSGKKTNTVPKVFRLYDLCLQVLQQNIDALDYVGGVPYDILKPVIEKASPQQLYNIEDCNPQFIGETEDVWAVHCKKDFRNKKPDEFETYRELYIRCHDERDRKLKELAVKVSNNHIARNAPVRQTKLAYVDVSAKPPRGVRRAQLRNGTAGTIKKQDPLCKLSSHASSAPKREKLPPPPKEIDVREQAKANIAKKAKPIAPMMKKTLNFIRKVPSLRR